MEPFLLNTAKSGGEALQQEATGIARFLRRKKSASEAREEEARSLLVRMLTAFASEVERLRALALDVELRHYASESPEGMSQAVDDLQRAGQEFYLSSRAEVPNGLHPSDWTDIRALLELVGYEHVDVLYLRRLRHDFGHLTRGAYHWKKDHPGGRTYGSIEHAQSIRDSGDILIAAAMAGARAISERERHHYGVPFLDGIESSEQE